MHVVYIHQYFTTPDQKGGTRSYELAQRLILAGHRVSMICGVTDLTHVKGSHGATIQRSVDGIDVHQVIEPYSNSMGFAHRWLVFLRFAQRAFRITKALKDVDLVFATSTPLTVGDSGRKGARFHHCPFVFEVRDLWPELPIAMGIVRHWPLKWYLKQMELRAYRAASRIIALAPGIKQGIEETGYPAELISVVPNSADIDFFRPADSNAEVESDRRFGQPGDFRLVFTGAHGLANGLDAVIDAVAVLKRRDIRGVRFCFIGEGGLKARLMERTRNEGLDAYVSWVDSIKKRELARLLPQMDAGMMILKNVPAFYRGTSPNKFFDYISCGLPVLNNYPGWLAEYIVKSKSGVVVPPDNPEAFADAVIGMMNKPDEARAMGKNGRQLAETEFCRDLLAETFVSTLENAVASFRNAGRSGSIP